MKTKIVMMACVVCCLVVMILEGGAVLAQATEGLPQVEPPAAPESDPTAEKRAVWGTREGDRLYISKGCIGCHGTSGYGGVGPDLAKTVLIPDEFNQQVRNPRSQMPPFPESIITDQEISKVYAYLQLVPPELSYRWEAPEGEQKEESCIDCHRKYHPVLVAQRDWGEIGVGPRQHIEK